MTGAACEAAARAWLERLPAAERLAAHARTDLRLVIWIGAGALLIAACLVLARADLGGRLRRVVEARGLRPWLASGLSAVAVAATLAAAKGLYDVLIAWPAENVGGSWTGRAASATAGVWSAAILALLFAPILQWLFRRRPRVGPMLAGLAAMAVCLAVGWGPYAFGGDPALTRAPPGPVTDALGRLITEAGVPARGVWLSRDPTFYADVTGGFGRAKLVVGQPMLGWPAPDARAYVGHLMGHYAHADVFVVFLLFGLVGYGALAAVQRWATPLATWLGARQATTAADPDAAPAAALILLVAFGVAMLATTGYLRWANVRADTFSLDHAREPDGLASVLVRTWDHERVDPNPIEAAIVYSHPPLSARLTHAMCWKTTHRN